MKFRKHMPAIVAALLCAAVIAEEQIVSTQAEGWGASRDAAIQAACEEGVKQINGFLFETSGTTAGSVAQATHLTDGNGIRTTDVRSESMRETAQKIKGAVKGYETLSCEPDDSGEWHAVLIVKVAKYKTPGIDPNTRRRMVIAPFAVGMDAFQVGAQNVSAAETAKLFRDKLETLFVQSRRFTVLGRQDTEAVLAEKNLILTDSANLDEYAKIGATLGTDYLLCGKITSVNVQKGRTQGMFTDSATPKILRAFALLNYRILVMPTGQVKWSGEVAVDLDKRQLQACRGDEGAAYMALLETASRDISAQALGNIYPVRVSRVKENGEVIIGEGGALRYEGELLDAYALGDIVVDPYSKESLGREETRIATIQIVRTEAKLSYARMIDGDIPAELAAANRVLCRPARMAIQTQEQHEEPTIKPPSATQGVVLPFDVK